MSQAEKLKLALKEAEYALAASMNVDIKVTEEDENDPTLLAELEAIKQGIVKQPSIDDVILSSDPYPQEREKLHTQKQVDDPMDIEVPASQEQSSTSCDIVSPIQVNIEDQIKALKVKCVQLKRAGNLQEAHRTLNALKKLQAQAPQSQKHVTTDAAHGKAKQPPLYQSTPFWIPDIASSPNYYVAPNKAENNILIAIRHRMEQYKDKITKANEANETEFASKLFLVFKNLQEMEGAATKNQIVDLASLPPAPPNSPEELQKFITEPTIPEDDSELESTLPEDTRDGEMQRLKIFARLDSLLVNQITEYHNRALREKKAKRQAEALAYLRKKKTCLRDLQLVRLAQTTNNTPPPQYHIETVEHKTELIHEDISSHEMEIEIVRLIDVRPPSLSEKTLDLYVTCEIPYPNQEKPQKFQTPVVRQTFSPDFNFKHRIRIERNTKFERFIRHRKLTLEIIKPGSWFFGRPTIIGKCEVRLIALVDHCESVQMLEILEGRKPNGGKAEVRVRLRTPCNPQAKTYRITQEKVLVIDKHYLNEIESSPSSNENPPNSPTSSAANSPPLIPAEISKPQQPSSPSSFDTNPQSLDQNTIISKSLSPNIEAAVTEQKHDLPKQVTSADPDPVASISHKEAFHDRVAVKIDTTGLPIDDPNKVDWIVSNAVLEKEMAKTQKALMLAKKNNADTIDLEIRMRDLTTRQQMLIIFIQQGKITVESYKDMLKEKIELDKRLAIALKQQNRIEEAQTVLIRAKLMEEELTN